MPKNYVSNKDESPRIFQNSILEFLSKTPWFLPLIVYIPIIIYLSYLSYTSNVNIINMFVLFILALFVWSFTEYSLHRFLFHYEPKSELGKKIHWTFHGVHHDFPMDSLRLVMPPGLSLLISIPFYLLFRFILGENNSFVFMSGFLLGYLIYDISHFAFHHFAIKNKFFLSLKKHHMQHHFQNPDKGFGVSSTLWDNIFKTNYKS